MSTNLPNSTGQADFEQPTGGCPQTTTPGAPQPVEVTNLDDIALGIESGIAPAFCVIDDNGDLIGKTYFCKIVDEETQATTFEEIYAPLNGVPVPFMDQGTKVECVGNEGDQTQELITENNTLTESILEKLNEDCTGNPQNVNVCNTPELSVGEICYGEYDFSGLPQPITGGTTILNDGTEVILTNLGNTIFSSANDGDIRWENSSDLDIQSNRPIALFLRPLNGSDPALGNPAVWSHQNGNPPPSTAGGAFTRLNSNGAPVIYFPSAINLQLSLNNNGGSNAWAGLPASAGILAQDDWGFVGAEGGNSFQLRGRDAEAMNISVIEGNVVARRTAYGIRDENGDVTWYDKETNIQVDVEGRVVPCQESTSTETVGLIDTDYSGGGSRTITAPFRSLSITAISGDVQVNGVAIPQGITRNLVSNEFEQFTQDQVVLGTEYFITEVK